MIYDIVVCKYAVLGVFLCITDFVYRLRKKEITP